MIARQKAKPFISAKDKEMCHDKENKLIHTPEGVRDIYNGECRRKLAVQEKILHTLYLYGYEHIQTPSFEYADIFNEDRGSVGAQEMFKFFDRDNNMLVLRPDMTPAVARCVAKYFMDDDMPLRLCYLERTLKIIPAIRVI